MDLKSISLFSSIGKKMSWLTERQKVLAQNIANANTPGYVPKDLKKVSFKAQVDQQNSSNTLRMQVGEEGHLSAGSTVSGHFEITSETAAYSQSSPDGNAVNLEDELMKMNETQMDYTLASNLYRKHISMLKTALGRKG